MPTPLTPNIPSAKCTLTKADTAQLVAALVAVAPLPQGITSDKLTNAVIRFNADGTSELTENFKQ